MDLQGRRARKSPGYSSWLKDEEESVPSPTLPTIPGSWLGLADQAGCKMSAATHLAHNGLFLIFMKTEANSKGKKQGTNSSFRNHPSSAAASPRGGGRTRGRDWVCRHVPTGTHIERNHLCKHETYTNLLHGGVGGGEGCPTSVCFHLKVTAFSFTICIFANVTTQRALCQGVYMRAHSERPHVWKWWRLETACVILVRRPSQVCLHPPNAMMVVVEGLQNHGRADGLFMRRDTHIHTHTQIAHLAFCPITGNIEPKGSGPISKESACNERSEARFYHRQ